MKLGCCINMLADERDPVGRKYIPLLKKWGYDYVEIPLAQTMELEAAEFAEMKRMLLEQEIPCECCNNFFPAYIRLTGEEVNWYKIKEYIKRAIEKAAELGAKIIVFGSSGAKNVPAGFSKEKAFEQIVKVLDIADGYSADKDIKIAIEPLNQKESNMILNLSEALQLKWAGNYKNVEVLVDYYHFMMEKEKLEVLEKAAESIFHIHFANPEKRSFPIREEEKYGQFFQELKNLGYNKRVSIEAYSQNPERDIELGTFIRKYF